MKGARNITVRGMPLYNSAGDIDMTSAGYRYIIDTLSFIRSRIIEQKFYEIDVADYIPVDVGEAAWSDQIVQNEEYYTGGGFFDGDVEVGGSRIASVNAALNPISMPVRTWRKKTGWTIAEIAQAANAANWDPVEAKIKSLKKNWDLGIQQLAFMGRPNDPVMTGFLNNPAVTINATFLGGPIRLMTAANFATFVAGLMNLYYANTNGVTLPDTFVIPTSDYLGLVTPVSSAYPMISMITYLLDAFKKITQNENFKILPLTYASLDYNTAMGIGKNRYVLYRNDPEVLSMAIPVDFTMLEARTLNSFDWEQLAYGQYSGVLINREREVLYIDNDSSSS